MTKKRIDKHIFRLGIVIVSSLCMSCTIKKSPSESEIQKNPFYELINEFANEFYYKSFGQYCVPESNYLSKNYLISPASLIQTICLVHDSTNETLKTRLGEALKIYDADFDYKVEIKKMITNLYKKYENKENNEYFFSKLSNALFFYNYIRDDLNYDVIDELVDTYSTNIYYCNPDDKDNYGAEFIKESTDNCYTRYSFPTEIDEEGQMLYSDPIDYVNFLFIKSSWGMNFSDVENKISFNNADESISNLDYIEGSSTLKVYEEKDVRAISIPLLCNHNFNVLLPNENTDYLSVINHYFSKFSSLDFSNSYIANANVLLPKFLLRNNIDNFDIFRVLSVGKRDDGEIWFNNLSPYPSSYFEQYVRFEINSNGLEQFSNDQTLTAFPAKIDISKRIDFFVNRPFMFSITNEDNIPLLIGQCNKI